MRFATAFDANNFKKPRRLVLRKTLLTTITYKSDARHGLEPPNC